MRLQAGVYIDDTTTGYRLNQSFPAYYTIWKDTNVAPTMYRAESNVAGVDDLSSTTGSTLFQAVIDALEALSGGAGARYCAKAHIRAGDYTLATELELNTQYSGIIFEGEGLGTTLNFSGNGACFKLTNDTERNVFRDMQIILTDLADYGFELDGVHKNHFDNIKVYGTSNTDTRTGFYIYDESHWNHIQNCYVQQIEECVEFAKIGGGYPHFNTITHSQLRDCSYGVKIQGQNVGVSHTAIEQFAQNGIRIVEDTGSFAEFRNVYVESTVGGETGLHIEANVGGITWEAGLPICTTPIVDNGIGANRFIGYGWQNGGYVTKADGETFAHALWGTPTMIQFTMLDAADRYIVWVGARDATDITVKLWDDVAGALEAVAKTIYWYAEYQP